MFPIFGIQVVSPGMKPAAPAGDRFVSCNPRRTAAMASSTPLPESRFSNIVLGMEVHLTAETEKKLKDLAAQSGRATDEIVEDAMAGYFDEILQIRETLDSRYDDIKNGRVKLIPGDQVEAYFRQKSNGAGRSQFGS